MKYIPLIFSFSLIFLNACQEKKSKSSSNNCIGNNYWIPGCPGYNQYGNTQSGSNSGGTGGTVSICYQSQQNFWQIQGCPGFCQNYPSHSTCSNGGSGTTTNPFTNVSSNSIYQNWGVQYPGGEPAENCSSSYAPSGINFTPYETRKASMAIQGKTFYTPASPISSQYLNTSSILKSVTSAKTFFQTDSVLKVRFKPRTQPENTQSSPYCYIPSYTKMSSIAGYTKLQFTVSLVGTKADGTTQTEPIGNYNIGVNSCTQAIDLSSYVSTYPNGVYLIVQSVRGNQGVFPNDYHLYGFKNSSVFSDIRSMDCWTMDIEVAADGTKTFD